MLRDCDGADSVIEDDGRIPLADGLLAAGRLAVGRLVDLRAAGRDLGVADLGRELAEFGRAVVDSGVAVVRALDVVVLDLALLDLPDVLDDGRADEPDGLAAGLRVAVDLDLDADARDVPAAAGLADDIVLAAAVSAFAAVCMALVAVFIACIADDIVFADAVALVAAAVILVAAEVTFVAADDTVLAAEVGEAELRLAELRLAVLLRAALGREAVERDAVDRDAVLRVDREPALRAVVLAAVLGADVPAVLRLLALGVALDVLEPEFELGRLAVPLDALRLTDLLRAVLAELRRVAARVVD